MRKLMIYIAVLSLSINLISCDENENATNLDYGFACCVLDQNGNDLLDPLTSRAIDTSQIKIYHIINGEPILYYNPMGDAPKGYGITEPLMYANIAGFVFHTAMDWRVDANNRSITIIKWDESESDTITVLIEKTENSAIGIKYWINGNEDIDWINQGLKVAKIVKTRE